MKKAKTTGRRLCDSGFPLEGSVHFGTQRLGMIPNTPCERFRFGLGHRVFKDVQAAQGRGFISDAIEDWPDDKAADVVRGALSEARKVVHILGRHLREYERRKK